MPTTLPMTVVKDIVARALAEDIGVGDITTLTTVPAAQRAEAQVLAKEAGVLAGLPVMATAFSEVDANIAFTSLVSEGVTIAPGEILARVAGSARALLTAERTAMNFLQRLSGIATLTAQYVKAVAGTNVTILDTRKTTPGLRVLEKYAVRIGGGKNHRFGLFDGVLIKDNHIAAAGGIRPAIQRARTSAHHLLKIEVEVTNLEEVQQALDAGAEVVMLDNMPPEEVRRAVALIDGRVSIELSGGITLDTVRAYAECGADFISVGALTHSAPSLDISLEFVTT